MKKIILFIFLLSFYSCNTTNRFVPDNGGRADVLGETANVTQVNKEPAKTETPPASQNAKTEESQIEKPTVIPLIPVISEREIITETEDLSSEKTDTEVIDTAVDTEVSGIVLVNGISGMKMSERGMILTLTSPIIFEQNKSSVAKQYASSINAVKNFIEANIDVQKIIVEGHADIKTENNAKSYNLSNQRALNTIDAIARTGLSRLNLIQSAVGAAVAADSRSTGRKVEFIVIKNEEDLLKYKNYVEKLNIK